MANAKDTSPAPASKAPNGAAEAPTARIAFSGVTAGIWPRTVKTADGRNRETWIVSLTRSYRDGNEHKRTHALFPEHLLGAAMALIKAWEFTQNTEQSEDRTDA